VVHGAQQKKWLRKEKVMAGEEGVEGGASLLYTDRDYG